MPTKSKHPDVPLPDGDSWAFLFERTDRPFPADKGELLSIFRSGTATLAIADCPDKTELIVDAQSSRAYTFAQLQQTATTFGEALKTSWSWRTGDVLAIYAQNDVEYPAVIWGCQWAGGVVTTASAGWFSPSRGCDE